jgi:hypothetical protein
MNQPADGDTSQPETLCLIGGVLADDVTRASSDDRRYPAPLHYPNVKLSLR